MLRSVVCLLLLLSAAAFAQTVPGTFKSSASSQAVRPVWNATVLAPPVATLSNGLSPTVIVNQDTVLYQAANTMTPIVPTSSDYEESLAGEEYGSGTGGSIYASTEPEESRSLGEVATSFRGTKQQRRVYTNDDIQKLPTKFGPSSNPAAQPPANPE